VSSLVKRKSSSSKYRARVESIMFVGMGIVNPIIPVFLKLGLSKTSYRRSDVLSCCTLIIVGLGIYAFNASFTALANWVILAGFVLYSKKIMSVNTRYSYLPLTVWFCVSLTLGFLFPVIDGLEKRVALYGGETNYTGFYLLIFSLALFCRNLNYAGYFVIVLTCLLTLSRTAAVVGLAIWVWRRYGSRFTIVGMISLIVCLVSLYYLASLFGVFDATGYVFGPSRLYQLNDTSTFERFELIVKWTELLLSDGFYFFIGYPSLIIENFLQNSLVVHNSFILKAVTSGTIYSMILVVIAYRILALEVFVVLMAYCFMLHGLLTIPLLVLLRFLFGNTRRIF
jgi:hypothetical protein